MALSFVSGIACTVVVPAQAPQTAEQQPQAPASSAFEEGTSESQAAARRRRPIEPGFEPGFTHCCGDFDHVMQVDCGERLLRCYANQKNGWKQTYGRNCKSALASSCYERGCLDVCEEDTP